MTGFGAFGKIPALGDFLRFDMPQSFIAPWDRWVQESLTQARAALGPRWRGCYTTAPIWRFTLTAGLAGPTGAQGILMPSVDRVGRQFPLTLATLLPAGRSAVQAHMAAAGCFDVLEHIALDALEDTMTPARLTEQVRALRPPPMPAAPNCAAGLGFLAVALQDDSDPCHALAAHEAAARFRTPSVWTAVLDGDTRLLLTDGLPGAGQVAGLFDLQAEPWRGVPRSERIHA
ncbi:type VI secretion system-associated protein TagF [Meridianimarinicoccus roseus]|uniref:Type VI secretion system-associated protein TagF n=1 Tax=Meridianimarinicoccus roseus TaxID=2072018 RepID=A0A2V2LH11_9RHOB|nr:type VI secretion system-associated protein TagF [Meridianimarinicoccus roseus]PWR01183.1 type VI secretion system-associated protein TagF [Meridianimarinicoccus roseus]